LERSWSLHFVGGPGSEGSWSLHKLYYISLWREVGPFISWKLFTNFGWPLLLSVFSLDFFIGREVGLFLGDFSRYFISEEKLVSFNLIGYLGSIYP